MVDAGQIVKEYFEGVSHDLRYPFCPGYQLVTLDDYNPTGLRAGSDYGEQRRVYTAVCRHLFGSCSGSTEFEFYFRNKLLQYSFTYRVLQYSRPYHWTSPQGVLNRPNYADKEYFNLHSKCPNFKVLLKDNFPVIKDGYPVTFPCIHTEGCQYNAASIYTFARLMHSGHVNRNDFITLNYNSWAAVINDCVKGTTRGSPEDILLNISQWPVNRSVLWTPEDLLQLPNYFEHRFVIPPYGLYSYYHHHKNIDKYGMRIPDERFDDVYKLEYELSLIHFTTNQQQIKQLTEEEFEELLFDLNEYLGTDDDFPEF